MLEEFKEFIRRELTQYDSLHGLVVAEGLRASQAKKIVQELRVRGIHLRDGDSSTERGSVEHVRRVYELRPVHDAIVHVTGTFYVADVLVDAMAQNDVWIDGAESGKPEEK